MKHGRWQRVRIVLLAAFLLSLTACSACVFSLIGGASSRAPGELKGAISAPTQALVDAAFEGIERERLFDHHVHVVGLGTGGTGAWVNPGLTSWTSPLRRAKFEVYADAAGIKDFDRADAEYIERLVNLLQPMAPIGKFQILAFDHHYDEDGSKNEEHSEFYTPNTYVATLAKQHPDLFVAAGSVHPYRQDAIKELEAVAAAGMKMVKWLPNAMGIDPAAPRLDPFYAKMNELNLVLLSHAGEEKAVEAEDDQKLGNPLRLRRALDAGVRVVVAHCASLGQNADLDAKADAAGHLPKVDNFDLFLRLLDDDRYQGLVFGEISAMTQANRLGKPLTTILKRRDLHARLVSGSDYPLPAINVVIRTGALLDQGYITEAEREALNEIYDFNPMLFDFVLKRTVRAPGSGEKFAAGVFYGMTDTQPTAQEEESAITSGTGQVPIVL